MNDISRQIDEIESAYPMLLMFVKRVRNLMDVQELLGEKVNMEAD